MNPLPDPVLHLPRQPSHVLARWGGVVMDVFLQPPSLRDVEAIRHLYDLPDTPPRFGLLVVLSPTLVTAPAADVRNAINAQLRLYQARIAAYAIVVEVEGLLGAAARAVVKGMHVMEAWGFPSSVVDSVPAGARFLCRHLPAGTGVTPENMVAALERVRVLGASA